MYVNVRVTVGDIVWGLACSGAVVREIELI